MSNIKKGFLFSILFPFFYSLRALNIKPASHVSPAFFALCISVISFLLLFPLFFKHRAVLLPKNFKLIFFYSISTNIAITSSIYGFQNLGLGDAMLLENSVPLFILLIVLVIQKTKVGFLPSFAIIVGFSGLSFILKPQLDLGHLAAFVTLGSAVFTAINCVLISRITKIDHPTAVLFYSSAFNVLLYAILSCFSRVEIYPGIWKYILFASIFTVLFRYCLIQSYSLLPPYIVAGFAYLTIIFSTFFDWIFWDRILDFWQIIGGVIIITSGLLILKENSYRLENTRIILDKKS